MATININSLIQNITEIKELENVISIANKQLEKLKIEERIRNAEREIKEKGYYLNINNLNIPNTHRLELWYTVRLSAWDNEYQSDATIDDVNNEDQEGWIGLLGFEFNSEDITKDIFKDIMDDVGEWESYDPTYAKSLMSVYLYCPKIQSVPITDGIFKVIFDREIVEWKIKDDIIYDEENMVVDYINDGDVFIIPANL